jgi:hypothetical protein
VAEEWCAGLWAGSKAKPKRVDLSRQIKLALVKMENDESPWDSERDMEESVLLARPILPLIRSFSPGEPGSPGHRRVARLCLFAARRALPCWDFYCDGDEPAAAISAAEGWFRSGVLPRKSHETPGRPAYRGVGIDDCRWSDTSSAADAAARLVAYIRTGHELDAMEALSFADAAIDQSPLGVEDDFRRWLVEVAVPAAFEDRSLTDDEVARFRTYDPKASRLEGQR